MKKIGFLASLVFLGIELCAQHLDRFVFGVGGGILSENQWEIQTTIGQGGLAGVVTGSSFRLSVGYQQASPSTATSTKLVEAEWSMTIFPNPCLDHFTLYLYTERSGTIQLALVDASGRVGGVTAPAELVVGDNELRVSMAGVPAGIYVLETLIRLPDGQVSRTSLPVICLH